MKKQLEYQRKGEINFVLIGAKGTGKTVYLYHLNDRAEVSAISSSGTIDYLESLKHDDKIEATSATYQELFFYYKDNNYNIEFQIDDYDGSFVESWSDASIHGDYKEKLTDYIQEAEGIFVFLPYEENNLDNRFEKMKKETQTFIDKIKDIYGEEHSELPIPIAIVVSKWDDSKYFKAENEIEKAIEYIENNPILNAIRKDLEQYFLNVDIIPISSTKNHNIIKPIELVLNNTFGQYEKKINELDNKIELLQYLSYVIYDMRFYKEGFYKVMYDEIESEIAEKELSKIKDFKDIKIFDKYIEENEETVSSLKEETQNVIKGIEKSLKSKQKKKIFLSISLLFIMLCIIWYVYNKYQFDKKANTLYGNILKEYKAKNYSEALQDIVKYNKTYNQVSEQHSSDLKLIQEDVKSIYRDEIDKQIDNIQNIMSLVKRYKIITNINLKISKYKINSVKKDLINKQFKQISLDKKLYDKALNIVSSLSVVTLSKDDVDMVLSTINAIDGYNEANILKDELDRKLKSIMENPDTINQINDENIITSIINIASGMQLDSASMTMLNKRLAQIRLNEAIENFLDELKSKDAIESMTGYIKINWKAKYGTQTSIEVNKILNAKFSEEIKIKLEDIPRNINNENNFNRLKDRLVEINSSYNNLEDMPIKINIKLQNDIKIQWEEGLKLYTKYNNLIKNGIKTSGISFIASKSNPLGFNTSDDEIEIYIDDELFYYYKQSDGAEEKDNGYSMYFNSNVTYYKDEYFIKIIESNTIASDRFYTGNFNISIDHLISLYNGKEVHIRLNDYYALKIKEE